jgi:steroid delta-isomerase
MIDDAHKIAAVHAYVDGFARGDADAIAELFAEDATVEDPVGTPIKTGKAEIHEFYRFSMATGAKLELLGDPRCAGDSVAFPFAVKLAHEGAAMVIEVIDTFRFDDAGKVVEMRAFWGSGNVKPGG